MKDLYDDVLDFYDAACPLKDRDGFKTALQLTISHDDLEVYFLIPPAGSISLAELRKKSNLPAPVLEARLRNLAFAVLVLVYRLNDDTMYERASSIVMSEQQIRKSQESPQRTFYATFFDGYIEGDMDLMRTQTPHYRVLSAEATIKKESNLRTVEINVTVPDQTRVLPIDIISEMIRQEGGLIGVSQCGCRSAKRVLGTSCDNLLETCFVFNEYAQSLIETGYARKVEYDEAIDILRNCEAHGLVHFSQNCEDRIRSLCNCCSCCCMVLKSMSRGAQNALLPSRYVAAVEMTKCNRCGVCVSRCPVGAWSNADGMIVFKQARCIGCGLCVTTCPCAVVKMMPREQNAEIPKNYSELYTHHMQEIVSALSQVQEAE